MRRAGAQLAVLLCGAASLAACERQDRRAVVGLDQHGDPIYASPEEQAKLDQEREDREMVKSVADGHRTVQSLSPQEKATLRTMIKGK